MLNWLFSSGFEQPKYGVIVPMYGVTPPTTSPTTTNITTTLYGVPSSVPESVPDPGTTTFLLTLLKYFMLPFVIPMVLTIGVLVYTSKKGYPISKRIWAIVIMLVIYFALFIGTGFLFKWW